MLFKLYNLKNQIWIFTQSHTFPPCVLTLKKTIMYYPKKFILYVIFFFCGTKRSLYCTCSPALNATSSSLTADSPSCSPRGDIIWAPAAATSCSTATTQVRCFLQSERVSDTCGAKVEYQYVITENHSNLYSKYMIEMKWAETVTCCVTCCPKLSAVGMPGASVPGILRRIFLQNWRMSLQDVSRSFSSTARSAFSWPACRNARRRPTSTAMQSNALWVNCTSTQHTQLTGEDATF